MMGGWVRFGFGWRRPVGYSMNTCRAACAACVEGECRSLREGRMDGWTV